MMHGNTKLRIITDSTDKANSFNSYFLTVFSSEGNIPHMQGESTGEPFTIYIKIIRSSIRAAGKKTNKWGPTVSLEKS